MKRKVTWLVAGLAISMTPANADVYVKVDAQGNAIGGAIMCDAATCGAGSQYSQLTLGEGERYVLQGVGVDYGIGNNNPNTAVRHESQTNEWVVTRNPEGPAAPAPTVERFTVIAPPPASPVQTGPSGRVDTPTASADSITATLDSTTATVDSTTATTDTATALLLGDFVDFPWWPEFLKLITAWLSLITL